MRNSYVCHLYKSQLLSNLRRACLLILATLWLSSNSYAQLSATANNNATELAQALVGTGVTVSNATLVCPESGAGFFTATAQSLGIGQGVVLTSGYAQDPSGFGSDLSSPNDDSGMTGSNAEMPGDAQLETLASEITYDACVLEFDVVPQGDTLKFDYIFGSEEYNDYVNAGFNDVFGFFISGPGIVGQVNIATVPGTTIPVAIDNVNCGSYGQYYVCNDWVDGFLGGCAGQCPDFSDPWDPEYDGLTVVLTAKAIVQPCQTYHLKLGVADVGDPALDSGVFIKEGSLTSAVVQASPDVNICPGQTTQLNVTGANSGAMYEWSPATGLSCTNCQSPIASPTITTTYTVTVSSGGSCSASDQVVVTTSGGIQATLTSTPSNCNASTGGITTNVITGSAPYTYNWSNTTTSQNLSNVSGGDYSVTITDAVGCSSTFTSTVDVSGAPTITGVVTDATCSLANGNINITINGNAPYSFSWSNGNVVEDPNALVGGNYSVTVTDVNGCTIDESFTVTTTVIPNIGFASDGPICTASNGYINATVAMATPPYSYSWNNGATTEDIDNLPAGLYELTVTDIVGCTSSFATQLTAGPAPPISVSGLVDSICVGSSFTVTASGYDTYTWEPTFGLSSTTGNSIVVTPPSNQTYSVIGADANGCIDTIAFDVTVLPFASVAYNDTFAGCEPLSVHLTATPFDATSVEWWVDGELVSTELSDNISLYNGTHDGMLIAISPLGCNDTVFMPQFVHVLPTPIADFESARDVASGSLFVFNFTNLSTNALSYSWQFGDSTTSLLTDPQHTFPGYGTYHVILTAMNEYECIDTAIRTIEVIVPHDVFIPNTITPNGDGMNDVFKVYGIGIRNYNVSIYDRLGEKVFEGTNDEAQWNGTFKNQALNTSTLVYVVDVEFLDNQKEQFVGDINVLR